MLRTGLLTGRTVGLAGSEAELRAALERLGAALVTVSGDKPAPLEAGSALGHPGPPAAQLDASTRDPEPRVDKLVADSRAAFSAAGGGYPGLRAAVDGAFAAARDTATEHWIDRPGGGQVILIAPAPSAGAHAGAARAALENLVRTLSTEWARHQITTVAVLPGDTTTQAALADLVAWLASPAGAYLSGTALTLDRPL